MRRWAWAGALGAGFVFLAVLAAQKRHEAFTDAKEAGPDFADQGEYAGTVGDKGRLGAHVVALGGGTFDVVFYPGGLPGDGWDGKNKARAKAARKGGGAVEVRGGGIECTVQNGKLTGRNSEGAEVRLSRRERKGPTLGMKPPKGAVVLFDGTGLDEWVSTNGKGPAPWKVLDVAKEAPGLWAMEVTRGNILTKKRFGDGTLHLEFRLPFMPTARGQERANSGVFVQNRYEVQILDSFGLEGKNNECAGLYSAFDPKVNLCYPPLSWQTFDIDLTSARFEGGKKVADAEITVRHNGVVVHDRQKLPGPLPGGDKESPEPGVLHLQDHGNPVQFRNIWFAPK